MKKTRLILAATCMLAITAVSAETRSVNECSYSESAFVKKVEINLFCKAIVQGDIDTVKKMITKGEDVNQKSLGMTPAIFAARYNRAKILTLLIEKGADLSVRSNQGHTIVAYAEAANAHEALKILNKRLRS